MIVFPTMADEDTVRVLVRAEGLNGLIGDASYVVRRGDPEFATYERAARTAGVLDVDDFPTREET